MVLLCCTAINKRKQTACNTKFPPSKRSMPGPAGPTRAQPMGVPSPNLSMQNQPQPSPQMQYPQPLSIIKTEPGETFLLATSTYQPTISPSPLSTAGLLGQFVASQPPALAPLHSNPSPQNSFSNTAFLQYTTTTSAGASTLYTTLQPMSTNPNFTQQSQQQQQQQNQQQQLQLAQFAANFNPAMPLGNLEQYDMAIGFSGELNNISLSGLLDHSLSENLSGRLNLSEPSRDDQEAPMNMSTDSISRLAVDTYDKLVEGATGSSH
ncbi:hypothetical protein B566_EDAN014032 [Ephemera danica]|nr:hypothetical protein B566_EDAN014032 [Ephemera danica]